MKVGFISGLQRPGPQLASLLGDLGEWMREGESSPGS